MKISEQKLMAVLEASRKLHDAIHHWVLKRPPNYLIPKALRNEWLDLSVALDDAAKEEVP